MELVLRSTAIFFFLWAVTRAMGKRELAEMSAFELVLLIVVGDMVQQGVTQEDYSVTGAMLAVATLAFWVVLFSYLSFRFPRTRPALEGEPVLVVRDGQLQEKAMHTERITVDEVLEAAREQGIRDVGEIDVAILEPGGKFAIIKADGSQHPPDERQLK